METRRLWILWVLEKCVRSGGMNGLVFLFGKRIMQSERSAAWSEYRQFLYWRGITRCRNAGRNCLQKEFGSGMAASVNTQAGSWRRTKGTSITYCPDPEAAKRRGRI